MQEGKECVNKTAGKKTGQARRAAPSDFKLSPQTQPRPWKRAASGALRCSSVEPFKLGFFFAVFLLAFFFIFSSD
jgi:hypothetical protein